MRTRAAVFPSLEIEQQLWAAGYPRIAGVDEAGRGAWAGPVAAAAVILPEDPHVLQRLDGVRDSKLMTPLARQFWAPHIRSTALAWGVGFSSVEEIDSLGILPATKLAAQRALKSLVPDCLVTDFLVFPELDLPQIALVKGDQLSLSVSAASVLAKTERDARMISLGLEYSQYGFSRHKGYGTRLHQEAILRWGLSEIHRKSFSISLRSA